MIQKSFAKFFEIGRMCIGKRDVSQDRHECRKTFNQISAIECGTGRQFNDLGHQSQYRKFALNTWLFADTFGISCRNQSSLPNRFLVIFLTPQRIESVWHGILRKENGSQPVRYQTLPGSWAERIERNQTPMGCFGTQTASQRKATPCSLGHGH